MSLCDVLQPCRQAWLLSRTSWGVCTRNQRRGPLFTRAAAKPLFFMRNVRGLFWCSPAAYSLQRLSDNSLSLLLLVYIPHLPPPHPQTPSSLLYITSSCATAPETTTRWPAAKHGNIEVGGPPRNVTNSFTFKNHVRWSASPLIMCRSCWFYSLMMELTSSFELMTMCALYLHLLIRNCLHPGCYSYISRWNAVFRLRCSREWACVNSAVQEVA